MFIPKMFRLEDRAMIAEVIQSCDFALLVTSVDGELQASHLPLLFLPDREPHGVLRGHIARGNPQWRALQRLQNEGGEALVIFQGPHAYVSPSWYGAAAVERSVPTWNYLAVHAYGRPSLIEDEAEVCALLDDLTAVQEAGQPMPWSLGRMDASLLQGMLKGIVAFEIALDRVEGKAKLSQNKPADQREGVMAALAGRDGSMSDLTAQWMRRLT